MNEANAKLIDRYAAGTARLRDAVAGLSDAHADALPVPGTWSVRQIVVHLMHAELFLVGRVLRIVAEDVPLVMDWDERAAAARLRYEAVPVTAAVASIEVLRATTTLTLRALADADLARHGIHSKAGRITAGETVLKACDHLDHHLGFAERKRAMLAGGPTPVILKERSE